MQLLRSLGAARKEDLQRTVDTLYGEVKAWDQARATALETHLRVVEQVMEALDQRVRQVEKYIGGLERLMAARIEEMTAYCRQGVNDSEFFLVPSSLAALKPCHQLLKHLLMEESQRELALSRQGALLAGLLDRLRLLQAAECGGQTGEGDSVRQLKSNLRMLIDCELPDLIQEVLAACRQVSAAEKEGDFYWAVQQFVTVAARQLQKHREIGSEVVRLAETLASRQKTLRTALRAILREWVKIDLRDGAFEEQLAKEGCEELIDDYYALENLLPDLKATGDSPLSEYLPNLQMLPFRQHERLLLFSRQVLYNGRIEAKLTLTQQGHAYLFRLQAEQPDFRFTASRNLRLRSSSNLSLLVAQVRRTLLLREQVEFEFALEFNLQSDMKEFAERMGGLGCQVELSL